MLVPENEKKMTDVYPNIEYRFKGNAKVTDQLKVQEIIHKVRVTFMTTDIERY